MVLKRQGYYKEMPYAYSSDPSIFDNIGKRVEDKEKICGYLSSGFVLAACGKVVSDVVDSQE